MDPIVLTTITSALVLLASKVAEGTAGAAGESVWNGIKALLGWSDTPSQADIAPRITQHLVARPDDAAQIVRMLQQEGSPVAPLVGSIEADKVVVAHTIVGTINM